MSPVTLIALRHLRSRHSFSFISFISYLSILGLGIGIAILILTLGILNGFENTLENKIISFDGHIRLTGFLGDPVPQVNPELDSVLNRIPQIVYRSPFIDRPAVIRHRSETEGVYVEGILPNDGLGVFGTPGFTVEGSFDLTEDRDGHEGVVLGRALSEKMGAPVGSVVTLFDLEGLGIMGKAPRLGQFRVAGLYEMGLREYDESVIYVSLPAAQRLFGYGRQISGEILKLTAASLAPEVANDIDEQVGYPYSSSTWKDRHRNLFTWLSVQKYPITIILALTALVAILNIMSSLTMIVMEKTRDIGVLRALGYSRKNVSGLFFVEGGIIGGLGVVLGMGLALLLGSAQIKFGLLRIPEDIYFMRELPVLFDPIHFVAVGMTGFVLSLVATIYPAWKASGILPAEAVRYE